MTQATAQLDRPSLTRPTPAKSAVPWVAVAWVGLLAVGLLPMNVKLGQSLWDREQYQFFPLMLVGAAAVAWERWQDVDRRQLSRGTWLIAAGLLAAGLAATVGSAVLWVRSLAMVSVVLTIAGVVWWLGGRRLFRVMLPPLILLAILVPPPGRQEQVITLRLQHLAVGVSCRLLDALHVPNAQAGNVIEIPNRRLLVEQACSGINSLMAVLAFTLLYGFYLRRTVWRLAVLLPLAVVIVMGGNVARITTEADLLVNHGIDVSAGVAHQLLGMVLFGVCVGLVASLDALLGGGGDGFTAAAPRPGRFVLPRIGPAAWAFAALFAVAGVWVEARVWHAWQPSALPATATFDLPEHLAGWDRVTAGAAVVERPATEGGKSSVWQYRRGDTFASVAIDYPFIGYHELVICYSVSGWTVRSEVVDPGGNGFRRVQMDKRAGGGGATTYGSLRFNQTDEAGRPVMPQFAFPDASGWDRLRFKLDYAKQIATAGASYQVQALMQTPAPPTAEDQAAVDALYQAARANLTAQLAKQLKDGR